MSSSEGPHYPIARVTNVHHMHVCIWCLRPSVNTVLIDSALFLTLLKAACSTKACHNLKACHCFETVGRNL